MREIGTRLSSVCGALLALSCGDDAQGNAGAQTGTTAAQAGSANVGGGGGAATVGESPASGGEAPSPASGGAAPKPESGATSGASGGAAPKPDATGGANQGGASTGGVSSAAGAGAGITTLWAIDSVDAIAGHATERAGNPEVITDGAFKAVSFDGEGDRLLVDNNPLHGASEFTIELIFKANDAYPNNSEPRLFHIESELNVDRRVTIELRLNPQKQWALDTFIKSELTKFTLLDMTLTHPVAVWAHAAITYKDKLFVSYVNGTQELATEEVEYLAIDPTATTSIGARMNLQDWFNGAISEVAITPKALAPDQFVILNKVVAN